MGTMAVTTEKEDRYVIEQLKRLIEQLEKGEIHAFGIYTDTRMEDRFHLQCTKTTTVMFTELVK